MIKKFLIIIGFALILLTGCNKKIDKVEKVDFIDDYGYDTPEEVTYKFTGVSEHFAFCTGKVYYGNNNEKYIYLDNFKIINTLNKETKIISYSINLLFDNKELFTDEQSYLDGDDFQKRLDKFSVEEASNNPLDEKIAPDAFLETTKESFKDDIKVIIKYCYDDNDCKTEELKINYEKQ